MAPFEKNVKKRIVKHPRGYYRDTGVLYHLLRIRDLRQMQSHPAMGFSWEAMVAELSGNFAVIIGRSARHY
ncbi:MAG: hypothetical protein CSA25_05975 [Desulfobacter postgatei]|uniref:DUF4143 domain-containing protein n=1 Tax=Desulfobacter postgatei TaxID=2293 RepID=A0A2G6MRN7_9BACT|nr:MAG: hypothetical protein CSA25_05975 [Desulfobacter postgatei]